MDEADKEQNGYRLSGQFSGAFLCEDCHAEHHDYVIDREHHPAAPITCIDCNESCISPLTV